MKLATAAYHPEWHADWAALAAKLDAWVNEAATKGAELLVFPEYAGIEAGMIGAPPEVTRPPRDWVLRLRECGADWRALHRDLAQRYGVHILAGSLPWAVDGQTRNCAWLCGPTGQIVGQDKMILTPYEREVMQISPGDTLSLIDTSLGKVGILVCYDSEFPLLARALVAAGADIILVPSCTELQAGQTRVRQSCRARAIEGQCLIVQSPLVGRVAGCEIIDTNIGRAGVFCPPDYGLPSDGIIAQGTMDCVGWVYAQVDPAAIAAPRHHGQVGNFAHWTEQDDRVNQVKQVSLRA